MRERAECCGPPGRSRRRVMTETEGQADRRLRFVSWPELNVAGTAWTTLTPACDRAPRGRAPGLLQTPTTGQWNLDNLYGGNLSTESNHCIVRGVPTM